MQPYLTKVLKDFEEPRYAVMANPDVLWPQASLPSNVEATIVEHLAGEAYESLEDVF